MCAPASDFSDYVAARAAFLPSMAGAADCPWHGQIVALEPVDEAEVLIVVDNYIDVLAAGSETVRRIPPRWDSFHRPALRAEHGLFLLLTVRRNGSTSQVLYDAGMGSLSPSLAQPLTNSHKWVSAA